MSNKKPRNGGAPSKTPSHGDTAPQPFQSPPEAAPVGRMSLRSLKMQAKNGPIQETSAAAQQQKMVDRRVNKTPKTPISLPDGLRSPNAQKIGEDGKRIQSESVPVPPTPHSSQPTPAKGRSQPLRLEPFSRHAVYPVRFDNFLHLDAKSHPFPNQNIIYPVIGLNPVDIAKLGIYTGDYVSLWGVIPAASPASLSTLSSSPSESQFTTPVKQHQSHTPKKNQQLSSPNQPFVHQHPSLSTPIGPPLPSHTSSLSSDQFQTGQHFPFALCRVAVFNSVEPGTIRLDPIIKDTIQHMSCYNHIQQYNTNTQLEQQQRQQQPPFSSPSISSSHRISSTPTKHAISSHLPSPSVQPSTTTNQLTSIDLSLLFHDFGFYISQLLPTISPQELSLPPDVLTQHPAPSLTNHLHKSLLIPLQSLVLSAASSVSASSSQPALQNTALSLGQNIAEVICQMVNQTLTNDAKCSHITSLSTPQSTPHSKNNISRFNEHLCQHFMLPNEPLFVSFCGQLIPFHPVQQLPQLPAPFITPSWLETTPQTTPSFLQFAPVYYIDTQHISLQWLSNNNSSSQPTTQLTVSPDQQKQPSSSSRNDTMIGGLEQEMQLLRETLELPLRHPGLFIQHDISPPKGVLLYGPPGCGKTLLATWLSRHTSARFINMTATGILAQGGADYLSNTFVQLSQEMTSEESAIIFIDEVDGLCGDTNVVCALLSLLDGGHDFGQNICILGATNRPQALPAALRRPGRFDVEVNIRPPNVKARKSILMNKLLSLDHSLSSDDISNVAEHANGYVGADIDLLISEAIGHNTLRVQQFLQQSLDLTAPPLDSNATSLDEISRLHLIDFIFALSVVKASSLRDYANIAAENISVGGHDEVKARLSEAFDWPLQHVELVQALGAKQSSGVLLFGPPGCAKTLLAKSICYNSKRTFICVKGPEMFSKYVGDSEKAVKNVFQRARNCAPCVLFLDELDSFGAKRGGGSGGDAVDRVVSQLLVEIDGIGSRGDVCILAASNRPDLIDPALLRAGRLDRSLYVGPPDLQETQEILRIHTQKMQCAPSLLEQLSGFATQCVERRHTGAELAAICRDAAVRALTRFITQKEQQLRQQETDIDAITDESVAAMLFDLTNENDAINSNTQVDAHTDDEITVTVEDFTEAVNAATPRITKNMIQFYLDYQKAHGLTNL